MSHWVFSTAFIGIGATAITDVWTIVRKLLFGTPLPNYGLVGRWFGHMPRGRFVHASISEAQLVPGEKTVGWTAHYGIGIAFAACLTAVCGDAWIDRPTIVPPVLVGLVTVLAPFLLMQPGMGAGIAASRTPNPTAARLQSLVTHLVFGLGLYLSAVVLRQLAQ